MIYLFLADGFEEIEALTPLDILRRANKQIKTVAVGTSDLYVNGAHGIKVAADMNIADLKTADAASAEMLILPGGMPGTKNLDKNPKLSEILELAKENDGVKLAAICAAPSILGKRGFFAGGKKAVCFPGFENTLDGADVLYDGVCRDGRILTAAGMGVALDFALAALEMLDGHAAAEKTAASVIADRR